MRGLTFPTSSGRMGRHKIALVDHLHAISEINVQLELENDYKNQKKLDNSKKVHINSVKKLVPYLNSIGKLSDNEVSSILSLDLFKMKNFKMKFNIGRK